MDDAGLSVLKRVDNKEQLPASPYIGCLGQHWNKEDLYKDGP